MKIKLYLLTVHISLLFGCKLLLGSSLYLAPGYKKAKEVTPNVDSKFMVAVSQSRLCDNSDYEHTYKLKDKVRDYLNSDLIGGVIIEKNPLNNKVVINNEIYKIGSIVEFPDATGVLVSPIPDVKIYVKCIKKDKVEFTFLKKQPQVLLPSKDLIDSNIEVRIN